jgi:DtxR family manganese transport transcriptional regulator
LRHQDEATEDTDTVERFRKVRADHRNETAEDYVELIDELVRRDGEARPVDIAARFGVSPPTVNKILGRLRAEGLVTGRRYRGVFLTEAGRALAKQSRTRHATVVQFLRLIGVDDDTAQADAEGIEHHVSDRTLAAFRRFIERSRNG